MGTTPAATGFDPRRLDLGRGRALSVRAIEPGDAGALAALYDGLDVEARYRRFFCAYRPRPEFLERMARAIELGNVGLVAWSEAPGLAPRLVAEAGYVRLPNGDGELALTVAAGWRGWLGPYLLDALLAAAAANGVPNLEADVLVANGPMLAVLRRRGGVVMAHEDWSVVRLLIGTGRTPTWPGAHDRPRLLVEGSAGGWQSPAAVATGAQVLACPGPHGRRSGCPALDGGTCPLAAGADLVVVSPAGDAAEWAPLVEAHRVRHAGVPVCVTPIAGGGPVTVDGEPVPGLGRTDVVTIVQRFARPVDAGAPS